MRQILIVVIAFALAAALSACGQGDPWEQGFANRICPVQGGEIDTANAALVVEHEGEKIGFCCPGCPEEFRRTPDRYMQQMRADPSAYGYRG
jgi:YHS domain-containing protein